MWYEVSNTARYNRCVLFGKILARVFLFVLVLCIFTAAEVPVLFADTASDAAELQKKIDERNTQIKQLEDQLNQYNQQASDIGKQKSTLQSTLKTLDTTTKKINTDLSLTQNKLTKTSLTIEQTDTEINQTLSKIDKNKLAIAHIFQTAQQQDDANDILMLVLSSHSIADAWDDIESVKELQTEIRTQSDLLRDLHADLESKEQTLVGQKKQLTNLQQDLAGKKQAVQSTAQQKAALLAQTKNKEAEYQKLIAATEAQKAQFEKDVFDFESQLRITINKNSYPPAQHGILSWPVDDVHINQLFGKTVGAEKLYVSGSHNGIDFRASIGTRIKNVLSGEVVGTGNTDAYPGCYSFGKWVMVRHDNGLSTIYGHLSVVSVSKGDRLATGDLVGYSGNTGYTTGPHLHISVYATEGVRIEQFVNSRGCKQAIIPLADVKAYLDPMVYFPNI